MFNKKIDYEYANTVDFKEQFDGISITYHALTSETFLYYISDFIDNKTLLILDEIHHAAENKAWGTGISELAALCGFTICLSGTPIREDNAFIPLVEYETISESIDLKCGKYRLKTDYEYTYGDSVVDEVCCATVFEVMSASLMTKKGKVLALDFEGEDKYNPKVLAMALRLPVINGKSTLSAKEEAKNSYCYKSWVEAHKRLINIQRTTNGNEGGLVVCKSIKEATTMYHLIADTIGYRAVALVHSQDNASAERIKEFKNSTTLKWLVSVDMVSEGVDAARIRVINYCTNKSTFLYFMQVLGRGVRNKRQFDNYTDVLYMYIPAYYKFINYATIIEDSVDSVVNKKRKRLVNSGLGREYTIDEELADNVNCERGAIIHAGSFTEPSEVITFEINKNVNMEGNEYDMLDLRKTLKEKKQEIHKIVNVIAFQSNYTPREIHRELNLCVGGAANTQTLEQLELKLKLATQLLEN
jgi:superfamily II DNA or RNA helicase